MNQIRNAIEKAFNNLALRQGYSTMVRAMRDANIVDLIMSELGNLGDPQLGPVQSSTGRSIDPHRIVSLLARGESIPLSQRSITISQMAEQYARHAREMDSHNPSDYIERIYNYENSYCVKRLAWALQNKFGCLVRKSLDRNQLKFYGPVNAVSTCKMTLDILIDQIKQELDALENDNLREQLCQEVGVHLDIPDIIDGLEFTKINLWVCSNYGNSIPINRITNVDTAVNEKAKDLARKIKLAG